MQKKSLSESEMRKGDALVENGMYVHAIQVYQKLLEEENWKRKSEKDLRNPFIIIWDVPTVICFRWKKPSNVSAGHMRAAGVRMH
ncbi:MAG: hypothetical protein V8Q73_03885 [Blautia sp.]